jgi:hypothetical protein
MVHGVHHGLGKTLCLSLLFLSILAQAENKESNARLKKEVKHLQQHTVQQQKEIDQLKRQMSLLLNTSNHYKVTRIRHFRRVNTVALGANPLNVDALPTPNFLPTKYSGFVAGPNFYPIGSASYLRHNFSNFYQIITQNSPQSYADNNICIKGLVCFSGMANFDLIYSDHTGHSSGGINPGSFQGLGVRPLFGLNDNNFFGSINNVNLFIDAGLYNWFDMHLDFAYINGSRQSISYAFNDLDWTTSYVQAAALKVNQAYVLFANPAVTPLFIQLGRFNAPFGDYQPFPITPSLTQLISEARTGGVMVGAILPNGFYAEAAWFMARQSMENFNDVYIGYNSLSDLGFSPEHINLHNKDRNYGGKIGFRGYLPPCGLFANVNASYIADIRDVNFLQGAWDNYNLEVKLYPLLSDLLHNVFVYMQRAPGVALHADIAYDRFGLAADFVTALKELNPTSDQSIISAYGFEGSVLLPVFCNMPSKLSFSYQHAQNADVFTLLAPLAPPFQPSPFPPFVYGNVLPHYRYLAKYEIHILPPLTASLEWVNDHDFKAPKGSDKSSNFAVMRLGFQF